MGEAVQALADDQERLGRLIVKLEGDPVAFVFLGRQHLTHEIAQALLHLLLRLHILLLLDDHEGEEPADYHDAPDLGDGVVEGGTDESAGQQDRPGQCQRAETAAHAEEVGGIHHGEQEEDSLERLPVREADR
jgi:hypothetical protein